LKKRPLNQRSNENTTPTATPDYLNFSENSESLRNLVEFMMAGSLTNRIRIFLSI
jgi:hypothetical protein